MVCLAAMQGEVLLAAGDRPPAIGVHVYHSTDGGDSWQDMTDTVFAPGGECIEVGRRVTGPFTPPEWYIAPLERQASRLQPNHPTCHCPAPTGQGQPHPCALFLG
jgi:hypothetical protein